MWFFLNAVWQYDETSMKFSAERSFRVDWAHRKNTLLCIQLRINPLQTVCLHPDTGLWSTVYTLHHFVWWQLYKKVYCLILHDFSDQPSINICSHAFSVFSYPVSQCRGSCESGEVAWSGGCPGSAAPAAQPRSRCCCSRCCKSTWCHELPEERRRQRRQPDSHTDQQAAHRRPPPHQLPLLALQGRDSLMLPDHTEYWHGWGDVPVCLMSWGITL